MIVGVDEAGRGCVVGPLVICGVSAEKIDIDGLKDSKLLTPYEREKIAKKIKKRTEIHYKIFYPEEIDEYTRRHKLNVLELRGFSEIIARFDSTSRFYVDACDVIPQRFSDGIRATTGEIDLISEHKADSTYPIVSAASILAKVKRDEYIQNLDYDLGSGYPSDKKTVDFLKNWYMNHRNFPQFVRKSWDTVKKIRSELDQQTLI